MADEMNVRIGVSHKGREVDPTVAELGVLLTAINRSLNKLALDSPEVANLIPDRQYSPVHAEPVFVQLRVRVVTKRSPLELQTIVEWLGRDPAHSVLLGVLGNAIYDGTKIIVPIFARALRRVSTGAAGKTIDVILAMKGVAIRLRAEISDKGKVRVTAERVPPDDTQ